MCAGPANPPDPRIARIYALAHLQNGQFDQAIEYAERAIALNDMAAINHLIMAIAEARRVQVPAARQHLDAAVAGWPNDLEAAGVIATAPGGVLWFETIEELNHLRGEAEEAIRSQSP